VIVFPANREQWQALSEFLRHYAGVQPSADLICMGWVTEEKKLVIVVGFGGYLGKVAQIHVAYAPGWHFTPRALLGAVFRYAFQTEGREMLLGILNSRNEKAMRLDLHLGFREIFRLHGMHDDGGDLVVLAMTKDECRYLKEQNDAPGVRDEHSAIH